MLQRVMSRYFADNFVSQYQKTLQGNPFVLCFGKFPVANKFMDKKGGVSRFSVGIFCLTAPKKFAGKPFRVSIILRYRIIFCFKGLCHDFSSKVLSRSTENFCKGTLLGCASEKFC